MSKFDKKKKKKVWNSERFVSETAKELFRVFHKFSLAQKMQLIAELSNEIRPMDVDDIFQILLPSRKL